MSTEPAQTRRPGDLLFAVILLLLALVLLSLLGSETKFSSRGKLYAQPAFWPGVGVIGMCVFGFATSSRKEFLIRPLGIRTDL